MIRSWFCAGCIFMAVILLPGCSDRLDMEDATFPLVLGLDLDNENKLRVYLSNPVFSKNVKKKSHEFDEPAQSLRQSRVQQDAHSPGVFQGRKFQVIVIGKRLLQQGNWFSLLDVIFRDSKNTVTDRVIAFNGAVRDIMYLHPSDEPYLPLLLKGMVDTKSSRSETVKTTVQELHREIYEKGMTPSISSLIQENNKEIKLDGTALLDRQGKYAASLDAQETVLLKILQEDINKPASLTFQIPGKTKTGPFDTDKISLNAERIQTNIKTDYAQDKFHFDIHVHMHISLTELLFPFDVRNQGIRLEGIIAEQTRGQLTQLIRKIQKHKIDPIGLGLYARAYQYKPYKKAEERWGEELAGADIQVSVDVSLQSMGPVK